MAQIAIGDKAVGFELPCVAGGTVALTDFADKTGLVIAFWCNHCPYVMAWEDRLIHLASEYGAKGIGFVAICANDGTTYPQDNFENMNRRAHDRQYSFCYAHDEGQNVARAYGAERTPEVFVFDHEHRLVYHGAVDDNHEDPNAVIQHFLRDALDAVLVGQEPLVQESHVVGCSIKWKGMI